ncbi:hypothetical protein HDV63DRAFT_16689 [Trichoderma sp. SZMC 28014]
MPLVPSSMESVRCLKLVQATAASLKRVCREAGTAVVDNAAFQTQTLSRPGLFLLLFLSLHVSAALFDSLPSSSLSSPPPILTPPLLSPLYPLLPSITVFTKGSPPRIGYTLSIFISSSNLVVSINSFSPCHVNVVPAASRPCYTDIQRLR